MSERATITDKTQATATIQAKPEPTMLIAGKEAEPLVRIQSTPAPDTPRFPDQATIQARSR